MGDVWFIEHGPEKGIYFEDQSDLNTFLEAVPREAAARGRDNPILAGIIMRHGDMIVRLATQEEMRQFRVAEFRKQQQEQIRRQTPRARQFGLPDWTEAFMLDKNNQK